MGYRLYPYFTVLIMRTTNFERTTLMSKYTYSFVAAATLAIAAPVFYNLGRKDRTAFYKKLFNYSCYGKNQMLRELCKEHLRKDLGIRFHTPDLEEN